MAVEALLFALLPFTGPKDRTAVAGVVFEVGARAVFGSSGVRGCLCGPVLASAVCEG